MVLVGGFYLSHFVNQQLKAKDATIETLNAANKLREAEIAALKSDRAPAIAADYKVMREHADKMTEDKRRLDERVAELTVNIEQLTSSRSQAMESWSLQAKVAESRGMLYAWHLLMGSINTYTEVVTARTPPKEGLFANFYQRMYDVANEMESSVKTLLDEARIIYKKENSLKIDRDTV